MIFGQGPFARAVARPARAHNKRRFGSAKAWMLVWAAALMATSAQAATFNLSDGRSLELPDLSELQGDCARIRETVDRIDETRYRQGPRPVNPADKPLFDYESRLSTMILYCSQTRSPTR